MLVLSRHRDERILIGDNIIVTVIDIRGDKVRLGIEAPESVPVHREEVYQAIRKRISESSQSSQGNTSRHQHLEPDGS